MILPMKFELIALLVQEKKVKIDFQHSCQGDHLGFPIRKILAIFDVHVYMIIPIKFRTNGPFYSGEEVQNRFLRWQLWGPSCISDLKILATFYLQVTLMSFTKFQVNGLSVQEKKRKIDF